MKRYITVIIILAIVIVGIVLYLRFDPSVSQFFPRCPFLVITGYKCPGCGSQRVIHSLLNGDIATAWHYNAFMVAALPVVALYGFAELTHKRQPRLYNRLNSPTAIWIIFTLVVLWWVLRNFFGW